MATEPLIRNVVPYLTVHNCAEAIDFYMRAFGAVEKYRMHGDGSGADDSRIGHTELLIGESIVYMSDEFEAYGAISPKTLKGTSVALVLDVENPDIVFEQAIQAGATVDRPIKDEEYGRGGWVVDPFGYRWNIMSPNPEFVPAGSGNVTTA